MPTCADMQDPVRFLHDRKCRAPKAAGTTHSEGHPSGVHWPLSLAFLEWKR